MIKEILELIGITLIPGLELRASIPYGILQTELHWFTIFFICVIVNIILGVIIYFLLDKVVHLFFFWKWFHKLYHKIVERSQKKIQKLQSALCLRIIQKKPFTEHLLNFVNITVG